MFKARLALLSKTQNQLLEELKARYHEALTPSELSAILNKKIETPKAKRVIEEAEAILKEWEG